MTALGFLALALAGGLGAVCRLMLDGVIRARTRGSLPLGTIVINLSGSLVLGLLTGLTMAGTLPDDWRLIAGTGFLGGYTTFSTASFETVRLLQEGKTLVGAVNGIGVLVATTALAGAGLWLGASI
ncbi:MAG: fluoride efflux transporter CrcB [Microbacterium sp.]|uniref:fluoride efflux transporter CrcB n=1 Tax=Microbacterium sp. TaxID=51671 RepID=UPI0039E72874